METPVLFLIFRRPDTTARVFEAIRQARPTRLFVAADGPRADRPEEVDLCRQTRALVANVDWPCEVKTLFQEHNLGIKAGVVAGISWYFSQVPEGIILEDDCLPHPDFFSFAGAMLERFRDDDRIFQISGTNFQHGPRSKASYFYSRYNHVWGWASWARAWSRYDPEMEDLPRFLREADRTGFWDSPRERRYWGKIWNWTRTGRVKTWDYQWKFTLWKEGALCVYPEKNLVTNLGFGAGATNTAQASHDKGARGLEPLGTLVHNPLMIRDRKADRLTFRNLYWGRWGARCAARWDQVVRLVSRR